MYIIEVLQMSQFKKHVHQHVRSAKEWLTKAEDAFAKQHDIRAELDLMLAQAELQHAKEVNRSQQWRYKYVVFRHGLALALAMCMTATLGGMYWWATRPVIVPVPVPVQVNLPVEVKPEVESREVTKIIPEKIQTENNISATQVVKEETSRPESIVQTSQSKQHSYQAPAVLSDDEVQKMVRAAGKTLRGQ